ncbi:hypothetical protein ACFO5X_06500 [Seohaeicola nanhaiensis]|uniref:Uncharacterized protein n=1 Tax=Seohaeicola nanhaiensis TaxID=1387282 RepID=A0ABV9KDP4_9RHOB
MAYPNELPTTQYHSDRGLFLMDFGGVGEVLNQVGRWLSDNREWLFSGIGIFVASGFFALWKHLLGKRASKANKKGATQSTEQVSNEIRPYHLIKPTHHDFMMHDDLYRQLHEKNVKSKLQVAFKSYRRRKSSGYGLLFVYLILITFLVKFVLSLF